MFILARAWVLGPSGKCFPGAGRCVWGAGGGGWALLSHPGWEWEGNPWAGTISPPVRFGAILQQSDHLENPTVPLSPVLGPSLTSCPSQVCKDRRCQNASLFELEKCVSRCHGHGVSSGRDLEPNQRVQRDGPWHHEGFCLSVPCASPRGAGLGSWLSRVPARGRTLVVL